MKKVTRISRTFILLAVASLVLLVTMRSKAQDEKEQSLRLVYQAQAMGQGTQLGKTFNVTVNIDQWSTAEERQVLVDAFQKAGSQGLYNALEKMHAKGRLAVTGTLGYDISFVRTIPTADGYMIRVLTNRPIRFGELWYNGRSLDYNLSALELNISDDKSKSGGVLLPAVQFKVDKKTGEVTAENYQNPWKLQNIMDRSK
jgi:hypothetical protein